MASSATSQATCVASSLACEISRTGYSPSSERLAVARVFRGVLEHALRAGDGARGGDHALALQLPHEVLEAFALFPDEVAGGHAAAVERQLCRVGRMHAEL